MNTAPNDRVLLEDKVREAYGDNWLTELGITYLEMCGEVPVHVLQRWVAVADAGHPEKTRAVEKLRRDFIGENPLRDWRVQQLVQFAQLLVRGQERPARLHAAAALYHDATADDLRGVISTATVLAGAETYLLGMRVLGTLPATRELTAAIEALREDLTGGKPLGDQRIQDLIHFAQLLVLDREAPARQHAAAALGHGATTDDLIGVACTGYVTAGVAAYSLGVQIVDELRAKRCPRA